jgi:hypothetical protein
VEDGIRALESSGITTVAGAFFIYKGGDSRKSTGIY